MIVDLVSSNNEKEEEPDVEEEASGEVSKRSKTSSFQILQTVFIHFLSSINDMIEGLYPMF